MLSAFSLSRTSLTLLLLTKKAKGRIGPIFHERRREANFQVVLTAECFGFKNNLQSLREKVI